MSSTNAPECKAVEPIKVNNAWFAHLKELKILFNLIIKKQEKLTTSKEVNTQRKKIVQQYAIDQAGENKYSDKAKTLIGEKRYKTLGFLTSIPPAIRRDNSTAITNPQPVAIQTTTPTHDQEHNSTSHEVMPADMEHLERVSRNIDRYLTNQVDTVGSESTEAQANVSDRNPQTRCRPLTVNLGTTTEKRRKLNTTNSYEQQQKHQSSSITPRWSYTIAMRVMNNQRDVESDKSPVEPKLYSV